ncbi:MAG TPA: DNA polymerase I, partial [Clostridiales bacterium UBA8960]|nr:DNA polymerase I [Clostridiales bacterium UBA8960]
MSQSSIGKIVIVDGNSLINRAFFAMSDLRNSKGIYTGGVHGLTSMVLNLIEAFGPTHFCVAFDMKGPTFRHLTYDAYKGTRKGMPDELAMQMPIVKEILDVLKIARMELQGYEADDLIGTVAKACINEGMEVNIITGDKDALQLVDIGAKVHITKKGITQLKMYTDKDVFEELGVHANQVIDFKGLSGDSSDNIPGIPSIGPKTASKLLESFGTVENLIENADKIENKRIRDLVMTFAEQAVLSKRLATIHTEVPIDFSFDSLLIKEPNHDEAIHLFKHYELNTLMGKLKPTNSPAQNELKWKIQTVDALMVTLSNCKSFGFKLFYDQTSVAVRTLSGASFLCGDEILLTRDVERLSLLKPIFENCEIKKTGHDIKRDYLVMMDLGIDMQGVEFDTFIAGYLLNPARRDYDLADLLYEYESIKITSEEDLLGKGVKRILFSQVELASLESFMASQIHGLGLLKNNF